MDEKTRKEHRKERGSAALLSALSHHEDWPVRLPNVPIAQSRPEPSKEWQGVSQQIDLRQDNTYQIRCRSQAACPDAATAFPRPHGLHPVWPTRSVKDPAHRKSVKHNHVWSTMRIRSNSDKLTRRTLGAVARAVDRGERAERARDAVLAVAVLAGSAEQK